jgi:hypothetical protein
MIVAIKECFTNLDMNTKTTHTIQDIEALLLEKVILLKTADTKEEKIKLNKQIKRLEKHFNDCNDKHINGKKYPERIKSLFDPTPMTAKAKKELLALIDSVEVDACCSKDMNDFPESERYLSGGSPVPGETRFVYKDKGW